MNNFRKLRLPAIFAAMLNLPVSPALAGDDFHFIHNSCKTGLQFSDPALMQETQNTITREEMEKVMNFMTITPQQCQNQ